jgi:hypothetical protein
MVHILVHNAERFHVIVKANAKLFVFLNVTPCILITHTHGKEEEFTVSTFPYSAGRQYVPPLPFLCTGLYTASYRGRT